MSLATKNGAGKGSAYYERNRAAAEGAAVLYHEGRPITVEIVRVTPQLAAEWLEFNKNNRPLSPRTVARYEGSIGSGRWVFNGEAIIFDDEGGCLNGQHRLHGCLKANAAFTSLVVRGVPRGVFATIDDTRRRSAADTLKLAGHTKCHYLGSALAYLLKYEMGLVTRNDITFENVVIEAAAERHPEMAGSVRRAQCLAGLLSGPAAAFSHYVFSRIDPEAADAFISDLASGEYLRKDDAVFWLRARLISNQLKKAKLPASEILPLVFKAWNNRRSKSPCKCLRWTDGEAFPTPL
jgi:hypothetical protein